jgi:ankyrin repeat protein
MNEAELSNEMFERVKPLQSPVRPTVFSELSKILNKKCSHKCCSRCFSFAEGSESDYSDEYTDEDSLPAPELKTDEELAETILMIVMSRNKDISQDDFEALIVNEDLRDYTNVAGDTLMHHAIKGRWNISIIDSLIPRFGVECRNEYGETALLTACLFNKDPDVLRLLIDEHHADVRDITKDGATVYDCLLYDTTEENIVNAVALLNEAYARLPDDPDL